MTRLRVDIKNLDVSNVTTPVAHSNAQPGSPRPKSPASAGMETPDILRIEHDSFRNLGHSTLGSPMFEPHESSTHFLQYGMIVSFMCTDRSGLMASEGFASCELRLERLIPGTKVYTGAQECQLVHSHYKDCLFEV